LRDSLPSHRSVAHLHFFFPSFQLLPRPRPVSPLPIAITPFFSSSISNEPMPIWPRRFQRNPRPPSPSPAHLPPRAFHTQTDRWCFLRQALFSPLFFSLPRPTSPTALFPPCKNFPVLATRRHFSFQPSPPPCRASFILICLNYLFFTFRPLRIRGPSAVSSFLFRLGPLHHVSSSSRKPPPPHQNPFPHQTTTEVYTKSLLNMCPSHFFAISPSKWRSFPSFLRFRNASCFFQPLLLWFYVLYQI